ncbi:protein of unknown function (DUF1837) [Desulfosporosinus orientis DSM 765]|uniref:Anti-bacteriophage protein A/HamA C-terminal domain-containing protein n=1 Tax=Desulfosporosinus orientis (strain ATCC 19365 / DSM 765 / NCIMB 8382 / VKM B-1628 / Singapore I) TaxID=768706 RepID=G7W5I1_DESOD|nr:DUF1837 domain-containing protein [Desulfosporosinus orientis]AET66628.1 protein of unknown function (DUF1837) [Desulfosporosinus orientis DSM 765]
MKISIGENDFLDSFEHLWEKNLDENGVSKLNLFVLNINANSFDYSCLIKNIRDPMIDYSVSRKIKETYKQRPATLTYEAQKKFKNYINNTGELGELLLYCFLETHLNAPKILSKLELKTSTSMYVHGADGIHMLKLDNGNYQLLFGESKTIADLTVALRDAFDSIYEFKNEVNEVGKEKSGINYEKTLLYNNLDKEIFSEKERDFLKMIIYPSRERNFEVDDAFGIFIGYEIEMSDDDKKLPNSEFRKKLKEKISNDTIKRISYINKKIIDLKLFGHSFYIYIVPFTELDNNRKHIMKEITQWGS